MIIYRSVFLDKGIRRWHVGFRLVVIVVRDEILDRIVGEKLFELPIKLCGQGLIVRHDNRWALDLLDHMGHGEGFSRASDTQKRLRGKPSLNPLNQLFNRLRLVASWLIL